MHPFEVFRAVPLRAEWYDFDTGRWDFDWTTPLPPTKEAEYAAQGRAKFDREDLLILKELQVDATRSFVDIAQKLGENYKMLAWHHKAHVLERGLVSGYSMRWMGTTYSTVLERALHRKHRYQHIAVLASGLDPIERMGLMGRAHGLPFLWNDMVAEDAYCANFYFPTEHITEAYQYLTDAISDVKDRVRVMQLDQTEALSFTLSYPLFDEPARRWVFDGQGLLSRFDGLVDKIKEIG